MRRRGRHGTRCFERAAQWARREQKATGRRNVSAVTRCICFHFVRFTPSGTADAAAGQPWRGGRARRGMLRECGGGENVTGRVRPPRRTSWIQRRGSRGVHPACPLLWFPCRGHNDKNSRGGAERMRLLFRSGRVPFFCAAYRPCPGAAVAAESHTVACFSRDRHDAIHVRTSPHRAPPFSCRASLRQLVPMARSAVVKTLLRKKKRKTRFCHARRGSLRPPAWQKSLSVPEARPFIMTFLDAFRMTRAAAPYA